MPFAPRTTQLEAVRSSVSQPLARDEIGVSKAFRVVEQRYDSWRHAEYLDLVSRGHWPWQGFLLRIFHDKHAQALARFRRVYPRFGVRRHGQAGNLHHLRSVMIDRQRHPVVACQVRRLLAVEAAEEVESEAFAR